MPPNLAAAVPSVPVVGVVIAITMTAAVLLFELAILVFAVVALAVYARVALVLLAIDARVALTRQPTIALDLALAFDLTLTIDVPARVPDAASVRADGLGPAVRIGALDALLAVDDLAVHDTSIDDATVDDLAILCVDTTLIVVNPIAEHALLRRARPGGRLPDRVAVCRVR
jgi:hypothetical protein